MRRYYNVDLLAMQEFGLTHNEWYICQNIEFLCSVAESGYTNKTRAELGEHHGLSADRMKKIILSLVERGFLKKNKKSHLKVSKNWIKAMSLNGKDFKKESVAKATEAKLEEELEADKPATNDSSRHFEEEYGEDEVSTKRNCPSKNEARKHAVELTAVRGTSKDEAVTMADSFWYKQEGIGWKRVANWKPLLKRFIDYWERNEKADEVKKPKTEAKIKKPKNADEMRLYLKQMSDEQRKKIRIDDKANNRFIVINHIGLPVDEEVGEYLSQSDTDRVLTHLCSVIK